MTITGIPHTPDGTDMVTDAAGYNDAKVGFKTPELWIGPAGTEVKLTADVATLNNLGSLSSRIVAAAAATLAVTQALHDGKTISLNKVDGTAVTLPAATGTGAKFRFFVGASITSVGSTITAAGSDVFKGGINLQKGSDGTSFQAVSSANQIMTLNGTTKGGIVGGYITVEDVGAGVWGVTGSLPASGTLATLFS